MPKILKAGLWSLVAGSFYFHVLGKPKCQRATTSVFPGKTKRVLSGKMKTAPIWIHAEKITNG
jgi:hypothetical protein